MKLDQHFYTSGKPEFMTVAVTEGIKREERLTLENHSIYFLPVSLHYQENITPPVKYVWYPLHEQRFVVGKAVYKGKDSLGRTGNYLFHNIILAQEHLMTVCYGNPVALITGLERNGIFQTDVPQHPVRVVEFSPGDIAKPAFHAPQMQRDRLLQMLYVCLHPDAVQQPLLLIGTDQERLDFLGWLYTVLPYNVRLSLGVDTYAYGVSLGFQIVGSPAEDVFRQGLSSSLTMLTIDPGRRQYASSFEMPPPSAYLTFMSDMITTRRIDELNAVYTLESCLRREHYERFKSEYRVIAPDLKAIVWKFHQPIILNRIVTVLDAEFLLLMQEHLKTADLNALYNNPEMIAHLVETGTPQNLELVSGWLCTEGDKSLFHPYLFKFHPLWEAFLERLCSHPQDLDYLLKPLKAFQGYYTPRFETTLLEHTLRLLPTIKQRKVAKEFCKAFEALPVPEDKGVGGSQKDAYRYVMLLRRFVIYEFSKDAEFLERLLDSDLAVLNEEQQTMVLDAIIEQMLTIRSLKLWKPDKVEDQLRRLCKRASEHLPVLRILVASIEKLKLSGETRKILQNVFPEVLETLPQNDLAKQIRYMIERLLKPSSSFLDKLTEKFIRLKKL